MKIKAVYVPEYLKDELFEGRIYARIGKQRLDKAKILNDKGEIKEYSMFYFIQVQDEVDTYG